MPPFIEKMKIASGQEPDFKLGFKQVFFKIIVVFEINKVKDLTFLVPKMLYYVTYALNYGMIRLRLQRATVPLLKPLSNHWKVKRYVF